jgi:hypothetical protein
LECIAYILAKQDQPGRATNLLGAADALRKLIDSTPTPMEQAEYEGEVAALQKKLNATQFNSAWDAGQMLTMDETIALALRED